MNAAWAALLNLLLHPLPPSEGLRVRRAFVDHLAHILQEEKVDPYQPEELHSAQADALTKALTEHAEGGELGWWLLMWVDWKAWDEVEWQAGLMTRTHGLPSSFRWERWEGEGVPEALAAFAAWLRPFGFVYLAWERGQDAYFSFIVPESDAVAFVEAARRAGLDVSN